MELIVLYNSLVWERPDSFIDADSVDWKEEKKRKTLWKHPFTASDKPSYLLFVTLIYHTLSFQYELNWDRSKYNFDLDKGPLLLVQLHQFIFLQQQIKLHSYLTQTVQLNERYDNRYERNWILDNTVALQQGVVI